MRCVLLCCESARLTIILVFVCRCNLRRGSCSLFDRYHGQNLAVRQPTEIRLRRRRPQLQRLSAILPAGQLPVFPLRHQPHTALGMLLSPAPAPLWNIPLPLRVVVLLTPRRVCRVWALRSTACSREAGIPSLVRVEEASLKQCHFVFIVLFYFFVPKHWFAPSRPPEVKLRAHFRRQKGKKGRKSTKRKDQIEGRGEGASSAECTTMSLQFFISSDINLPVAIKMYNVPPLESVETALSIYRIVHRVSLIDHLVDAA